MSLITTPATIEASPTASQPLLEAVKKKIGVVPNLFRVIGNSPASLEGFLGLKGALGKGSLSPQTCERIALAVAQVNGCSYCLSAHTYLGKNAAKLDDEEMMANRDGGSKDPKAAAAVRFATRVALERGHINPDEVRTLKDAGYDEAQIIEIVFHVALNTLTNYVNEVAGTEIDFPVVNASK